jgi:hypothetical protein
MTVQQEPHNGADKAQPRRSTEGPPESVVAADMALAAADAGQAAARQGETELRAFQANSREWMGYAQAAYQANARAWRALVGCRTLQGAVAIQSHLMQEQLKLMMSHGGRVTTALASSPANKPAAAQARPV